MAEVVDIAEESKKYEDEWVLFEVTEVDEIDTPISGRLLFHGKSREVLHLEAMKVRDKHTYAFFTGDPVPPNMIPVL